MIYLVHRDDVSNVGDANCIPCDYYPEFNGIVVDILQRIGVIDKVIVGGGGLIDYHDSWESSLKSLSMKSSKSVAWGVGCNNHNNMCPSYRSLSLFTLVGCRDWCSPFEWVPCVSCKSVLFDVSVPARNEIVGYWHKETSARPHLDMPEMTNNASFQDVIGFLASADTVLTNTYHGVYWATLLGKKVVAVEPFSNRFLFFKHRPVFSSFDDAVKVVKKAVRYPESLAECREANDRFAVMVRDVLEV